MAVCEKALEAAAQIHKVYEPEWNSRADALKTIVSLSSASIVLSVTFSSALRTLQVAPVWRYVVISSFVLFVLSLVLAFVALRVGTNLYKVQSGIFEQHKEIRNAVINASSSEDFYKAYETIVSRAFTSVERSEKRASRLFNISSFSFCLAVTALATVGVVQLLS